MLVRTGLRSARLLTRLPREFAATRYIFRFGNNVRTRESSCQFRFGVCTRSFCDKLSTGSQETERHDSQSSPDLELIEEDKELGQDCITDDIKSKLDGTHVDENSKDKVTINNVFIKSSLVNDTNSKVGGNLSESKTLQNVENESTNTDHYPFISQFQLPSDWRTSQLGSPGIKFPGDVYVIKSHRDELQYKDVLEALLQEKALGFDAEHCPVQHLVCVVQLATNDIAVLWQCMYFKQKMPHYLRKLLVGDVKKVGHACMDDAIMISTQFKEEPQHLIDTFCWAKDMHCMPQSLQGVCAIFLGQHLSKTHQQSNWKNKNLSPGQIRYAATDAWISLKVYEEMKRHAERLGVTLTPMYKNLQERYQELLINKRLKNRRRRQRIQEKKQELKAKALMAQGQNTIETNQDFVQETNVQETNVQETNVQETNVQETNNPERKIPSEFFDKYNIADQSVNKLQNSLDSLPQDQIDLEKKDAKKTSAGSRQRHKKFLAKFHSLE